jgi:branched-chain amino acid transport system ATP-binding protein
MFEAASVYIRRGRLEVIRDVSLTAASGQVVSVIGTNGAGKSSLMLAIAGLLQIAGGEIRFEGDRIDNLSPEERSRRGIALVPEGRWLFADLTVEENLRLGAFDSTRRGALGESLDQVYGLFPKLADRRSQIVSTLSGGEQQMTSIGRALMTRPKLLVLDEPSVGLAPVVVEQVFDALRAIVGLGLTVIVVEQNVEEALRFSSYAYVLANGSVSLEGPANELLRDERVTGAYLTGQ